MDIKTYKIGETSVNFTRAPETGNQAVVAQFEIGDKTFRKVFQAKNADSPMLKSDTILYKLGGLIKGKEARRRNVDAKVENGNELSQTEMRIAVKMAIAEAKNRESDLGDQSELDREFGRYDSAAMESQHNPILEGSENDASSKYVDESEPGSVEIIW
jgi:hypothetical protein